VRASIEKLAITRRSMRETGMMKMATTGVLGATGVAVPARHTFHGEHR
jgi:hypothetical protein